MGEISLNSDTQTIFVWKLCQLYKNSIKSKQTEVKNR